MVSLALLMPLIESTTTGDVLVPPQQRVHGENRLLSLLPKKELNQFIARCEPVELAFADILIEVGERIHHVCFPTNSHISLVSSIDHRASLGVALVGNEGMHGISLALGVAVSPVRAIVQGAGTALRMNTAPFLRELKNSPALQGNLNRYIYVLIKQLGQAAACTRFHTLEARLARWLLMTRDRTGTDELHITHESLALMLGVRRVGITMAAGLLQKHNLITYSRGHIMVLDHAGLESISCACYRTDKTTYDSIMR